MHSALAVQPIDKLKNPIVAFNFRNIEKKENKGKRKIYYSKIN